MIFKVEPVRLEGRHVVLEPLEERHLDGLAALYAPGIWQWYTVRITSPARLREFLAQQLRAEKTLPFAIRDRASGALVGATRFLNIDAPNRRVEIGSTWYAPAWQRTYANTEAKLLMLTHAFEALGCIAVQLQTDVLNERSRRAIERLGAKLDGILRAHRLCEDGRIRDSAFYSITRAEWPEVRGRLTERLSR